MQHLFRQAVSLRYFSVRKRTIRETTLQLSSSLPQLSTTTTTTRSFVTCRSRLETAINDDIIIISHRRRRHRHQYEYSSKKYCYFSTTTAKVIGNNNTQFQQDHESSSSAASAASHRTKQICETPIGSLTADQWNDATTNLIDIWTTDERDELGHVQESLQLLQRLLEEHKYNNNNNNNKISDNLLKFDILKKTIFNWRRWRKLQPQEAKYMVNPKEVLEIVDNFIQRSSELVDETTVTRIYNAIMEALISDADADAVPGLEDHNINNIMTTTNETTMRKVQQVFDRITNPTAKSYEYLIMAHIRAREIEKAIDIMDQILQQQQSVTTLRLVLEEEEEEEEEKRTDIFDKTIFDEALAACVQDVKGRSGADLAEAVLDRMDQFYKAGFGQKPWRGHYGAVCNAWAKSGHPQAGEKAEEIVHKLQQSGFEPNTIICTNVMDAWARQGNPSKASQWLDSMCERYAHGHNNRKPSIEAFNTVLNAFAKSGEYEAGINAERCLQHMWKLYENQMVDFKPDSISYNCVIHAWAGSGHLETVSRAEMIFWEYMRKAANHPHHSSTQAIVNVNAIANAFVKAGNVEGAENFLATMHSEYGVIPNASTFGIVIDGIAQKGGMNAGHDAEAILRKMEKSNERGMNPSAATYTSAIHAWAQSAHPGAGEAATRLLRGAEDKARKDPNIKPDARLHSAAIDAWAKSGHRNAGGQAERLLREMQYRARHDPDMKPNLFAYTAAIDAWAKSGQPVAGVRAEQLLQEMQEQATDDPDMKPNFFVYAAAINAWAKSRQPVAGMRAEKLLRDMQDKARNDPDMKPNMRLYTAAIDAWAKSRNANAGVSAERLLHEMQEKAKVDPDMKPTIWSYCSAIDAWAKSRDARAGTKAEQLLREMHHHTENDPGLKPNGRSYASAIEAWAKSGHSGSGAMAEKLLQVMKKRGRDDPDMKPDVRPYSSAIDAWASQGNAEAAEALLKEMTSSNDRRVHPNAIVITGVIKALSRSSQENVGERADEYLELLETLYQNGRQNMKPTVVTYKLVHKCWMKSKGHPNAQVRLKDLEDMVGRIMNDKNSINK